MSSIRIARPARRVGLTKLAIVVLVTTLGTAAPTLAQEGSHEIEAAMQRLHELTAQAERAHEQGRHERAEQLAKQAEQLEQRIHRHMREQDRAADREHAEREHADREHAERERGQQGREHNSVERTRAELGKVLEGLKKGIWALRQIGRNEEAQHLGNIAEGVARRLDQDARGRREQEQHGERERGADAERQEGRRQLAVMRYAVEGLVRADRHDGADLVERAMHALKLRLDGRRDEEAMRIRDQAPGRERLIELLSLAARELHEQGRAERSKAVRELASKSRRPREAGRAHDTDRRRETDRRPDAQHEPGRSEIIQRQMEVMQLALAALREAERKDLAETIERAINLRRVNLLGLEGERADMVRERAPSLGQTVEILYLAARLWREFGDDDKAEAIADLAEHMWAQRERSDRDRPQRDRRRNRDDR